MDVVVPFAADRPKTRLAALLDADERRAFARAMLEDVLDALRSPSPTPQVRLLATAPLDAPVPVDVDERPLTPAVNGALADRAPGPDAPVAVVMADLALATPETLGRLFGTDGDVVAAAGLGGGTNALVVRHPDFRVDYHGASYRDHLAVADEVGADLVEFDSRRLAVDVDEPADLREVLLHTDGAARDWLVDAGFELAVDDGRVGVARDGERVVDD